MTTRVHRRTSVAGAFAAEKLVEPDDTLFSGSGIGVDAAGDALAFGGLVGAVGWSSTDGATTSGPTFPRTLGTLKRTTAKRKR